MRSGVIAVTNAGQQAAVGFLEQAIANNSTCAGFAIFDGEKMNIGRIKKPDLKTLTDVFSAMKDNRVNMHLANYPNGYMDEDIQPFILVGDDGNAVISCMLDGDWVNCAPTGSSHSDEFFVALNQLRPLFAQLYKLTKGDLNAILEEVDGDATKNTIKNLFINRGTVHLMFSNGAVRTISKNDLEMDYPWGHVSNHYAYTEDKPPEEKPNPLLALLAGKTVKKEDPPTLEIEPKTAETPVTLPPSVPKKKEEIVPGSRIACPREYKKAHKVQKWYKDNCGQCPNNYMEYPLVEVLPPKGKATEETTIAKSLTDLGKVLGTSTRILPALNDTIEDINKRKPPGITGPKVMPPVAPLDLPKPKEEPKKEAVPSMSPESQKGIVDKFLKETESMVITTDRSGNKITNPKDAPGMQEKYAAFTERLGLSMDEIFTWKTERLEKLMFDYPDAMLHLTCDLLRELAQAQKTLAGKPVAPTLVLPKKTG